MRRGCWRDRNDFRRSSALRVTLTSNEAELAGMMRRARSGDKLAYETLLRELIPLFRTYYLRRVRDNRSELDDFVQECLIAVHQRQITYDLDRPLTPWIFAIAKYKLIDRFRARKASLSLSSIDDLDLGYETESALNARLDVDALLESASPKQRAAIVATKIRGESVAEHAAASNVSMSDVKVSVHRGLKALAGLVRGKS